MHYNEACYNKVERHMHKFIADKWYVLVYSVKSMKIYILQSLYSSHMLFEPVREETNNLGSDQRAVQSQKMVRGWK